MRTFLLTAACTLIAAIHAQGQGMILLTSGSYCAGTEATLTLSSSLTDCSSITWSVEFGAELISQSGRTARVRWNSSGATAEVIADYVMCNGSVSGQATTGLVTVGTLSTPTVSISTPLTLVCPDASIEFSSAVTDAGENPTYIWRRNGVVAGTNGATYTDTNWTEGMVVTLTLNSSAACPSPPSVESNSITIQTRPPETMTVTIAGDTELCEGKEGHFSVSSTPSDVGVSYRWRLNGENVDMELTQSSQIFTPSFALNTNDAIACNVTVVNKNGHCLSAPSVISNSLTITNIFKRVPAVSITTSAGILCTGEVVGFTAHPFYGGTNPTYDWSLNGQSAGVSGSSYSTSYTEGTTVTVTMISNESCVETTTATTAAAPLVVNPLPEVPPAIVNPPVYQCTTADLYGPVPGATGNTYYWQTSPDKKSTAHPTTVLYTVGTGGTYYLRTKSDLCWSNGAAPVAVQPLGIIPGIPSTSQLYYFVDNLPLPEIVVAPGANATICRWYTVPSEGSRILNDANQVVPPMQGVLDRTFYVSSLNQVTQCESSERLEIQVELDPDLFKNYIREKTILISGKKTEGDVSSLGIPDLAQTTRYFDGLGSPFQEVTKQGSPSRRDIVVPQAYDPWGREYRKYLPYVDDGGDGNYKSDALKDPSASVTTEPARYQGGEHYVFYQKGGVLAKDEKPYAETVFEASPLNRVLKQGSPGSAWQPSESQESDRSVKKQYEFNKENEVLFFDYNAETAQISFTDNGVLKYYDPNQLYANKTVDEHNNEVIEYTDKEGKTILKKVQCKEENDVKSYAKTYYVYDDFGNLVMVLPPEATEAINATIIQP